MNVVRFGLNKSDPVVFVLFELCGFSWKVSLDFDSFLYRIIAFAVN